MEILKLFIMFIIYGSLIIAGLFLFMQCIWGMGFSFTNRFKDRLLIEWQKHGKIIIAIDFDDTLKGYTFKSYSDETRYERTVNLLKRAKKIGAYIVIWTAAEPSRYEYILWYTRQLGLEIDSINKNPIELPYGNNGKIYANLFLDDRAGISQSLDLLESVIKEMEKI